MKNGDWIALLIMVVTIGALVWGHVRVHGWRWPE